jgi:hypothetical protein
MSSIKAVRLGEKELKAQGSKVQGWEAMKLGGWEAKAQSASS